MVDWTQCADYLRCHPNFHGRERKDFVLVRSAEGSPFFAQFEFLFECDVSFKFGSQIYHKTYSLALIRPSRVLSPTLKDKELGLLRLEPEADTISEFILLASVIRGAHVIPDFSVSPLHVAHIVNDVIDADMFLRVREHFPGRTEGVLMEYPDTSTSQSVSSDSEEDLDLGIHESYLSLFMDDSDPDSEGGDGLESDNA